MLPRANSFVAWSSESFIKVTRDLIRTGQLLKIKLLDQPAINHFTPWVTLANRIRINPPESNSYPGRPNSTTLNIIIGGALDGGG